MSTILDALRKVEEDNRTRSADARARLLSFPSRPEVHFPRRRRTPWFVGIALILAGFAVGAVMFWQPHTRTPEESRIAQAPSPDLTLDKGLTPSPQPAEVTATTPSAPVPLPAETVTATPSVPPQPQSVVPPTPTPQEIVARAQSEPPAVGGETPPASPIEKPVRRPSSRGKTASPSAPSAPGTSPAKALPPELNQALSAKGTAAGKEAPAELMERLRKIREGAEAARATARARPETRKVAPSTTPKEPVTSEDSRAGQLHPESREASPPAPALAARTEGRASKPSAPPSLSSPSPPNSSLSFLQWSTDPDKRIAFIKVDGGPLTLAHEGDIIGEYTVVEIRRNSVELRTKNQTFSLQVEE